MLVATLRRFGGRYISFLVAVDFEKEATLADVLAEHGRMRDLMEAFVAKFKEPHVEPHAHGPIDVFHEDHLGTHMLLEVHGPIRTPAEQVPFFDAATEEGLVAFFHARGLDVGRRAYPRRRR